MVVDREELARTFDRSAALYDEARPGYPPQLFEDLVRLSGLGPNARVLELGCGTGKASLPMAARGVALTCLEPGPNLAGVAARLLAPYRNARVVNVSFEDWPLEGGAFDLVFAATSWEWMDPAVKFDKVAAALKRGGSVAIFINLQVESRDPDGFWALVQECYWRHAPHMVGNWLTLDDLPSRVDQRFIDLGFEEVAVLRYPWVEAYDTDRYLKVLQTFSNHIALADEVRAALLRDIASLIDTNFEGRVEKHWHTVMQIARKS